MSENINFATKINFDKGVINSLDVNRFKNILVLTGVKNSLKVFEEKIKNLIKTKYYVYSGISANPTENTVYKIINFARDKDIDCILSIGGGAVMDCGKMVSLLLSHGGLLHNYQITGTIGTMGISPNLIYHITIPTVSGTGSEMTPVTSFHSFKSKKYIFSPYLFPKVAYIDPELMAGIPKKLWANIAFDCFVNALESYVSVYAIPSSDAFAEESLKTFIKIIPQLLKDVYNVDLISKMIAATINAVNAVNLSSSGAVHALADAISATFDLHNGVALAMICGEVCQKNYEFNKPKYDKVKELFGKKQGDIKEIINKFIASLDITIPSVKAKMDDEIKELLVKESFNINMRGNPKIMNNQDIEDILNALN